MTTLRLTGYSIASVTVEWISRRLAYPAERVRVVTSGRSLRVILRSIRPETVRATVK